MESDSGPGKNFSLKTRKKESHTTVSFSLSNDQYDQLAKRLPNYGDRSSFFRTVVKQYLEGTLEIKNERKF